MMHCAITELTDKALGCLAWAPAVDTILAYLLETTLSIEIWQRTEGAG
jgi:hypothetical protein